MAKELKYDIYTLRNSQGSGEGRPYVRILQHEPMSEKALLERIQDRCSLTRGDVAAVLAELHDIAVQEFSEGRRVFIPELGYFSLSASLEMPAENPDKKVTGREVKLTGISFRPEAKLMQELQDRTHFIRSRYSTQSTRYSEEQLLQLIKEHLKANRYITARIMRTQFGLTKYTALKWLKHFCEEGVLVKDGAQRSPIYFLK